MHPGPGAPQQPPVSNPTRTARSIRPLLFSSISFFTTTSPPRRVGPLAGRLPGWLLLSTRAGTGAAPDAICCPLAPPLMPPACTAGPTLCRSTCLARGQGVTASADCRLLAVVSQSPFARSSDQGNGKYSRATGAYYCSTRHKALCLSLPPRGGPRTPSAYVAGRDRDRDRRAASRRLQDSGELLACCWFWPMGKSH